MISPFGSDRSIGALCGCGTYQGVHIDFDHIPFGVGKINRQCVAVAGLADFADAGIADAAVGLLELVEISDFERQLIDGADTVRCAPRDDNQLVMVPRCRGHKREFPATAADAAVRDYKPDRLRIERDHRVDVAGIDTAMRQLRVNW